jgi:hypothetical protein
LGQICGKLPRVAAADTNPTLHEEIARVLTERGNTWTHVADVARAVNDAGGYEKGDGSAVSEFQVHGRTKNYSTLFERDGQRVRLRSAP